MRLTLLCLLPGLFAECAKPPIPVSVPFVAQFDSESLRCAERSGGPHFVIPEIGFA